MLTVKRIAVSVNGSSDNGDVWIKDGPFLIRIPKLAVIVV